MDVTLSTNCAASAVFNEDIVADGGMATSLPNMAMLGFFEDGWRRVC